MRLTQNHTSDVTPNLVTDPNAVHSAGDAELARVRRGPAATRRALLGVAPVAILASACGVGGSTGQDAAPRGPIDRNQKDELT